MKLVVIEAPAKRDTLKKYLGSGYEVFATKGHIRDLPAKSFAIDLNNNYEPHYVAWLRPSLGFKIRTYPRRAINKILRLMNINIRRGVIYLNYDKTWFHLIDYVLKNDRQNVIQGSFVGYDDSPRRGNNGSKIIKGATPEKFEKYFNRFYKIIQSQGKPYIFLTAWNEWGEGAYLEPDAENGLDYLKAIKKIVM